MKTTEEKIELIQKIVSKIGNIDLSDENVCVAKIKSLGSEDIDVKVNDEIDYWSYEELSDETIDVLYDIVKRKEEDYDVEEEKTFKRISD